MRFERSASARPGAVVRRVHKDEAMNSVPARGERFRRPDFAVYGRVATFRQYQTKGEFVLRAYWPGFRIEDVEDWEQYRADNAGWRLFFNSLGWLTVLSGTDEEGNDHPTDWPLCKAIVMRFLDCAERNLNTPKSDVWHDHAMAYRVSYLSYLYEKGLAAHLDADEDSRLRRMMDFQIEQLRGFMKKDASTFNNHTIFHVEGLADASQVFTEHPADDVALCQQTLKRLIDAVVDRETGITNEQAAFYQVFLIGRLMDTRAFFVGRGVELPGYDDKLFAKMVAFKNLIEPRPGVLPAYGDTKHEQGYANEFVARANLIPEVVEASRATPGGSGPILIAYPKDGYFIFRAGALERELYGLFLHRSERGAHGHWDGGSFISYYGGECAVADGGGPFQYKRPLRFLYFQSQLAHNSVIFNDVPVELKTTYRDHSVSKNEQHGAVVTSAQMSRFGGWYRVFGQWGDKLQYVIDLPLSDRPDVENAQVRFHPAPERRVETIDDDAVNLASATRSPIELRFRREELRPDRARNLLHAVLSEGVAPHATQHKQPSPLERLEHRSLVTQADGEFTEGVLITRPLEFATVHVTSIRFEPGVDVQVELAGNTLHLRPHVNGQLDESASLSLRLPDVTAPSTEQGFVSKHAGRIWRKLRGR
jgi:hypothetical protein